jgi:alkylhydroperoxidase/carboxymuconolactone decarboxylase family protein YurZ
VRSDGQNQDSNTTQLSARDVSVLNVAIAATQSRYDDLRTEIEQALQNGVTRDEILAIVDEVVTRAGGSAIECIRVADKRFQIWNGSR